MGVVARRRLLLLLSPESTSSKPLTISNCPTDLLK